MFFVYFFLITDFSPVNTFLTDNSKDFKKFQFPFYPFSAVPTIRITAIPPSVKTRKEGPETKVPGPLRHHLLIFTFALATPALLSSFFICFISLLL